MDCYFRQEWKDPRLAFNAPFSQISLSMKMLELIWKPDTYFLNGKESYLHKIPTSNRLVRLSRDGSVLYSSRLTIKASCPMQLQNFPLDQQTCPLWIGSFSYSSREINYQWKIKANKPEWKPIQIDDGVKLSQFDLLDATWNGTKFIRENRTIHKFIGMNIALKRHMGYYVLQVYVPCIMLIILSWVSFFINREATSDRSCIGIMCVLSLATLSFDVRNDIPSVPYATALDWFLYMCYLFLFASLLEFTIVHYFTKVGYGDNYNSQGPITDDEEDDDNDDDEDHEDVLNGCKEGMIQAENNSNSLSTENSSSAFKPYKNAFFDSKSNDLISVKKKGFTYQYQHSLSDKKKRKSFKTLMDMFYRCLTNDPAFKKQMTKRAHFKGINSVSKCDRLSRIIFPVSFLLLNILYWYIYYN